MASARRHKLRSAAGLLCLGMIVSVDGCQAPAARRQTLASPAIVGSQNDPCDQSHRDFMAAAAAYHQTSVQAGAQDLNQSLPSADLSKLRADAEAADDALAGLVGTFGTLAACRSDRLAAAELRAAHVALEIAGANEKVLAARLAQQQGGRLPAAPAKGDLAATALATEQPYLATDVGEIYDRPDSRARPIAALRKGQRLTSPAQLAAANKPGWLAIDLNDGSTGYVTEELVRPLSGQTPAGVSGNASTAVVAIDLITEALPEKLAALQARLAAAEATANGGT